MPATSKSQQRLMGMVHAYNKGELGKVSPELRKKIKSISKSMKKKDVKHFAETSHEDLPAKKKSKKSKKASQVQITRELVKLANHLDSLGYVAEADLLDQILLEMI